MHDHTNKMKIIPRSLAFAVILATPGLVFGAEKAKTISAPDLTVATNRSAVDRKFTYNLGPTGMRGWIWTQWSTYNSDTSTADKPWQILVTSVGKDTPAAAAGILPNDVILGVQAGGGAVSLFTKDARKSLGLAIGDADGAALGQPQGGDVRGQPVEAQLHDDIADASLGGGKSDAEWQHRAALAGGGGEQAGLHLARRQMGAGEEAMLVHGVAGQLGVRTADDAPVGVADGDHGV